MTLQQKRKGKKGKGKEEQPGQRRFNFKGKKNGCGGTTC